MLFYGSQGTGKTTLAKIIMNHEEFDHIYLNASNERGIDVIREKIETFAQSATFKKLKIIVLDEADYITSTAQAALRNIIETYSLKTRFILTANYLERIIEPLQSRFQVFKIEPPSKGEVAQHLMTYILPSENISFETNDIVTIINKFFPDIRKIIGVCQQLVKDGILSYNEDILGLSTDSVLLDIIKFLKNPNKETFNSIRQLIVDSDITDYGPLFSGLWKHSKDYGRDFQGEIAIQLAQYIWSNNTVIDKELNFMACIYQIITILK